MARQEGFQELVVLFDDNGSRIDLEMRFGQFNSLLAQKGALESHSGRTVKAAYAQVGAGLAVHAVVFFQLRFNDNGYMDPAFNLPLEYMALNAGEGPDLGRGPISMASRSQCPVPWHGINMWEPIGTGKDHSVMLVQKAVWRNRLGLKPVPATRRSQRVSKLRARADGDTRQTQAVATDAMSLDRAVNGSPTGSADGSSRGSAAASARKPAAPPPAVPANGSRFDSSTVAVTGTRGGTAGTISDALENASSPTPVREANGSPGKRAGIARMRAMEEKLTAAFGPSGQITPDPVTRQHRERMGEAAAQFRAEMERQQRGYLEQIKNCRREIQELKAALRHEQKRNQRLQELLRGDV